MQKEKNNEKILINEQLDIKWAEKFWQEEIDGMVTRCRVAFEDYDGFRRHVPKWYTDKYRNTFKEESLSNRIN